MSDIEPVIALTVAELQSRGAAWEEFSAVLSVMGDGRTHDSWGYWFASPEGDPQAFAVASWDVNDDLKAYLDGLYPDGTYPIRVLVQFNRISGRYNVEFEDSDRTRWQISPGNWKTSRDGLRPNLYGPPAH